MQEGREAWLGVGDAAHGLVALNVSFNEYWECDSENALWRARSSRWDSLTGLHFNVKPV